MNLFSIELPITDQSVRKNLQLQDDFLSDWKRTFDGLMQEYKLTTQLLKQTDMSIDNEGV